MGFDWTAAALVGTVLSATSIAVSVVILEELGREKAREGKMLVNAAVLDDVLGLAILSAVISIVVLKTVPTVESVAVTTVSEMGFWVLILLGAVYLLPKIIHVASKTHPTTLESRGTEAGATTLITHSSSAQPPAFVADHPFVFVIQDMDTGNILFIGRLSDPSQGA